MSSDTNEYTCEIIYVSVSGVLSLVTTDVHCSINFKIFFGIFYFEVPYKHIKYFGNYSLIFKSEFDLNLS